MRPRAYFCGAINGSVIVRRGETPDQAIARAQHMLLQLLDRSAKSLGDDPGHGPNLELEIDN
jgi:hypothetical protein